MYILECIYIYIYVGLACIWCPWLVRSIVSLLSLFTLGVLCLHFPRDYSYSRSSKLFCLLFGDSTHTGLEVGKIVFWKIFARWKRGYGKRKGRYEYKGKDEYTEIIWNKIYISQFRYTDWVFKWRK